VAHANVPTNTTNTNVVAATTTIVSVGMAHTFFHAQNKDALRTKMITNVR
jgi:hypothetical protein